MAAVPIAAATATTTSTTTGWSDVSSSSSSSSIPNWVMLDPYVFKSYDLATFHEDETTSPQRRTSEGEPFRVSFRVSPPPAVSRLYLHLPRNREGSETTCCIVGSHRNALLFCLYVPIPVPVDKFPADFPHERLPRFCRQELFIYTAGNPPSLMPLPPCREITVETDEEDGTSSEELFDPLAGIVNFSELEGIGVFCNDDGDFVVAYLCVSRELTAGSGAEDVEAQMCLYSSSESEWKLHALPIHCEQEDIGDLISWSTKRVLAFETYLCWVDNSFGMLFCDVFREDLRVSYIKLPVCPNPFHEPCVDMYRNICVGEDEGKYSMKFADVRPHDGYVYLPRSGGFEFNLWTLVIEDGHMNWKHEQEYGFAHNELDISNFIPSPHGPLTFPVVSMDEPTVAYFVVGEPGCGIKKVWLLSVNLISKSVEVFPYLNGNEDLHGEDADMAKSKSHCFEPFLPSCISKFIPQITGVKSVMKTPISLPITGGTIAVRMTPYSSSSYLQGGKIDVPEPNVRSLCPEAPKEFAWNIVPRPQDIGAIPTKVRKNSFRLLCPVNLVGGIIGKRGTIIQQIMQGTGASVGISGFHCGCMERVITIAALEGPEQCSKVQGALFCIFERMVELGRNAPSMLYNPSQSIVRVLLRENQLDYLVGAIDELVSITRARLQILHDMDVPACAAPRERVLQITGDLFNVSYALYLVSWKLRDHVFSLKNFYNSELPSSDFSAMDASRRVNISSGGQYLTGVLPVANGRRSLSYGMGPVARRSFSYGMGPVESCFSTMCLGSSEVQKSDENCIKSKNSNNRMWIGTGGINRLNMPILV